MAYPATDRRPIVVLIGALAPYTHVLYEWLAARLDGPLHVIACGGREPSRLWDLPRSKHYRFEILPGLRWHRSDQLNVYFNPAVTRRLREIAPRALVLNDFAPTMVLAANAARRLGIPVAIQTDGVLETDPGRNSAIRRAMRRTILRRAAVGLGACYDSLALLRAYGLGDKPGFVAPLFPAWAPEQPLPSDAARPFDVMFCGSLNDTVKGARFFTEVVLACRHRGRPLHVRVVGDGPLRSEMEQRFSAGGVPAQFDGFLQPEALSRAYASARLFHFPSRGDVWGLVVNEALQCGTNVLASPHSGAARELLAAYECGLVRPLEVDAWVNETLALLADADRRGNLRAAGLAAVARQPDLAADAYLEALHCMQATTPSRVGSVEPRRAASLLASTLR